MRDVKKEILKFWFEDSAPAQWFRKNPDFDAAIAEKFMGDYELAVSGIFDGWKNDAEGCLALCILFDQFPRNMFRDSPRSFSTDPQALSVARHAVGRKYDALLPVSRRPFIYLPFEHSESAGDQAMSVKLFETLKNDDPVVFEYACKHKDVIDRFGRFPHRNRILGRENTAVEQEYLDSGGGF